MDSKRRDIRGRIERLEEALRKGAAYLETGAFSNWAGFQPFFRQKLKDDKPAAPHPDWVRNVFLPHVERKLRRAEDVLDRLS